MTNHRHRQSTIGVLVAYVVSGILLHAAGLDYLTENAKAIVIGTVDTRVESAGSVSFTINVARVLSGNLTTGTANVVHPWIGLLRGPAQTITMPLMGMWFLTEGTSGSWDVLTVRPTAARTALGLFLPVLPTAPSGPYAYGPETPIVDALVNETAAGFLSAANQDRDPRLLLSAFYQIDDSTVRNVLSNLAASGDLTLGTIALTGSLERSIPGSIATLVRLWPVLKNDLNESLVVAALRDSWRDKTPESVQQLTSFAIGLRTDSNIRAAAVRALAAIHTKATLPFLGSLLASSIETEQVQAVYGLSSFANNCPAQTQANATSGAYLQCDNPGPYKTDQTFANFAFPAITPERLPAFLSFWQKWWTGHPELH